MLLQGSPELSYHSQYGAGKAQGVACQPGEWLTGIQSLVRFSEVRTETFLDMMTM